MFQVASGDSADELWRKATLWFDSAGKKTPQVSRRGNTCEILHAALSLSDPRQRWIPSRLPAMNPAFALAEVIWILRGRNDSHFLNFFNPKLPGFAGGGQFYHGAYGFRLRQHFGVDQLKRAYRVLSANHASRQVVLQIWDGSCDLPNDDGSPRSKDIPCNVASILKIRNGRLEWTQIMRSNDLVLGMPYNFVQFTSLQEVLAGWLGVGVGGYHHFSDSLHVYDSDAPVSERVDLQPPPRNDESIALPKEESDRAFTILSDLGDTLTLSKANDEALIDAYRHARLPPALRNWAILLTADALRRAKVSHKVEEVMSECSNECLALMFERWLARDICR